MISSDVATKLVGLYMLASHAAVRKKRSETYSKQRRIKFKRTSFLHINMMEIIWCLIFDFGIRKDSQIEKHDKVWLKSFKSVVCLSISSWYRDKTCSFYTFVLNNCETIVFSNVCVWNHQKTLCFETFLGRQRKATGGSGHGLGHWDTGTPTGTPRHQERPQEAMGGLGGEGKINFLENGKNVEPSFVPFDHFNSKISISSRHIAAFVDFGIWKDSQIEKHDKVCVEIV